jgi:hypothetical protein
VQQSGQRVRLGTDVGRDFEHDLPVPEDVLFGDKDAAERPATELAEQLESREVIARDRKRDGDVRQSQSRVRMFTMQSTERIDLVGLWRPPR